MQNLATTTMTSVAVPLYEHFENGTLTLDFLREHKDEIMTAARRQRLRNPLVWLAMETRTVGQHTLSILLQCARMVMHVCPELLRVPDVVGLTVVHDAARWCWDEKMLELIMTHEMADINGKDQVDYRPLHYAAVIGNVPAMKQLIKLGADIEAPTHVLFDKFTPLYFSLQHPKAVSLLLGAKASATWTGENGLTLLHCVPEDIRDEDVAIETARMLLMAGAGLEATDSEGRTPADRAASMDRKKLLAWLRRAELRPIVPSIKWRPSSHWLCCKEVRDAVYGGMLVANRNRTLPLELWFCIFELLPVFLHADVH